MKRYLSKEQRSDFITFNMMAGYIINRFLPEWSSRNCLTEEEKDKLSKASDILIEVKDSILNRMDEDYRGMLSRDSKNLEVVAIPKDKAEAFLSKFRTNDKILSVDRDILDTFAGITLELCSRCYKSAEGQGDCLLKKCYTACGVDVFNDEVEEGLCPYRSTDSEFVSHEFLTDFLKGLFKELKNRGNVIAVEEERGPYGKETSMKALSTEKINVTDEMKDSWKRYTDGGSE